MASSGDYSLYVSLFCIVPLISYRYLLLCIIEISIIKALQGFGCDGKATAEQKMNVIP